MPSPGRPPVDARRHPRYELFASVELRDAQNELLLILPARNVSFGGVYLTADGHDLRLYATGAKLELVVFDAVSEDIGVRATAEVVRHDEEGMALVWMHDDPTSAAQLKALLKRLESFKGG
jgi:hypothetical protein